MTETVFEWDEPKAESNYRKHGVDFVTAIDVFFDPFGIEQADPRSKGYGEERTLITGMAVSLVLTVVYVERGETIRIISARRAETRA
jgi:uncharacterized protein